MTDHGADYCQVEQRAGCPEGQQHLRLHVFREQGEDEEQRAAVHHLCCVQGNGRFAGECAGNFFGIDCPRRVANFSDQHDGTADNPQGRNIDCKVWQHKQQYAGEADDAADQRIGGRFLPEKRGLHQQNHHGTGS
ncbi:hypothetical protein D3C75_733380 [compost metagenome]